MLSEQLYNNIYKELKCLYKQDKITIRELKIFESFGKTKNIEKIQSFVIDLTSNNFEFDNLCHLLVEIDLELAEERWNKKNAVAFNFIKKEKERLNCNLCEQLYRHKKLNTKWVDLVEELQEHFVEISNKF